VYFFILTHILYNVHAKDQGGSEPQRDTVSAIALPYEAPFISRLRNRQNLTLINKFCIIKVIYILHYGDEIRKAKNYILAIKLRMVWRD
jgi:hypothetical protein